MNKRLSNLRERIKKNEPAKELQEYKENTGIITETKVSNFDKKAFAKVILKNAPTLLSAIPVIGNVAGAITQATIGSAVDYWNEITTKKRQQEFESYLKKLDARLQRVEIKQEAKDYFENSIVFKYEDIKRKLFTEPGRGFDELLAEFVATSLSDLHTPPTAKDLILSSLLSIDSVDIKVFLQIDVQFKNLLRSENGRGVSFADIVTLMKSAQIDSIMISRSIQRLQSQDLIHPLNTNSASIQELPAQRELLEGVKSPQYYSQGGFVVSAFGRRFLRFLKLSD